MQFGHEKQRGKVIGLAPTPRPAVRRRHVVLVPDQ